MSISTTQITNPTARAAVDALQAGDKVAWAALFTEDVVFTDDGKPRDFASFTDSAIGDETFTSIERVAEDGRYVYGDFHSEQWGDFKVFFRFEVTSEGKISKLAIGQGKG